MDEWNLEPNCPQDIPLCVDLDGTLVSSNTLHESCLLLARCSPRSIVMLPKWLAVSKANLRLKLSDRVNIDPLHLPYCPEVLHLIEQARASGQRVVLATASSRRIADSISTHLGTFDDVISSDGHTDLSAENKADALVERFGRRGFDYIGNRRADLPVIATARNAWLITRSLGLRRAATARNAATRFIDTTPILSIRMWAKALRVHQWIKNALVFVPILAAHKATDLALLIASAKAFAAFSLCASSVYVLNDLLDLSADRAHPRKRTRPFASGALPIGPGLVAAAALLIISAAISLTLPIQFSSVLTVYFLVTTAYSLHLKNKLIIDVITLAGLYTLRILAGAAVTGVRPSFWLLAYSMFVFLSLAMVKRHSELQLAITKGGGLAGRSYRAEDIPIVLSIGSSSGMISVLVLALYTQAESVSAAYRTPEWLWLMPPLMLYWISRLWMKSQRAEIQDDPVVFAATDRQSLFILSLIAITFILAMTNIRPWLF